MFPIPDRTPEFEYRLVKVLEHPVRIGFLKLLAGRGTLSAIEARDCLENGLPLSKVTYHVRVLNQFGLVEAAGQPDPDRGVPFRSTPNGQLALAALGHSPQEGS
ncbi:MAG TPA: helix-turn-helix domain-containing protein [Solirubrobacterales bacterium]|nr:helix-turn-helix domain-containing protein [Solirubrobacterales bacterium]